MHDDEPTEQPAPVTCPQCGCKDGFIHTDEDGSEFVCPDCTVFDLTADAPATVLPFPSLRLVGGISQ